MSASLKTIIDEAISSLSYISFSFPLFLKHVPLSYDNYKISKQCERNLFRVFQIVLYWAYDQFSAPLTIKMQQTNEDVRLVIRPIAIKDKGDSLDARQKNPTRRVIFMAHSSKEAHRSKKEKCPAAYLRLMETYPLKEAAFLLGDMGGLICHRTGAVIIVIPRLIFQSP